MTEIPCYMNKVKEVVGGAGRSVCCAELGPLEHISLGGSSPGLRLWVVWLWHRGPFCDLSPCCSPNERLIRPVPLLPGSHTLLSLFLHKGLAGWS